MLVSQVTTPEDAQSLNLGPSELKTLRHILFQSDARATPRAASSTDDRTRSITIARQMYKFRRKREDRMSQVFGAGLFADPAWDLLLDLYIHSAEGEKVSISSACLGSAVAETTALRYISEFQKMGVVERHRHEADGRVYLLCLTPAALELMDEMCAQFAEMMQVLD